MEEKKSFKISLVTTICLALIILLIAALIGVTTYYKTNNKNNNNDKAEKHSPITADTFQNYIVEHEFNVYEALDYIPDSKFREGIKIGYLTEKKDNTNFQVNYFEFKDEAHTMYSYYDEIIIIAQNNTGELIETNESESNYSKYTAFSNGYYYVMIRIDNTIIYTKIEQENKEVADNLLKNLGY